jgi:hypothetical protein
MHRISRIFVISAALLAALVLATFARAYLLPLPSDSTAQGTVVRYYELIGRGRALDAQSLLSPEYRTRAASWTHPIRVPLIPDNQFALYGLGTEGQQPTWSHAVEGYRDQTVVYIHYSVWLGDGMTYEAGKQFRQVIVGRKDAGSPWLILDIGTGG